MKELEKEIEMLISEGRTLEEVKDILEKRYKEELSLKSLSFFSYLFIVGFPILLIGTFILKVLQPNGIYYYLTRLFLLIGAMGTLKGLVGHFVGVFLKRDHFNSILTKFEKNKEEKYGNN